jgi:hypothetical protein
MTSTEDTTLNSDMRRTVGCFDRGKEGRVKGDESGNSNRDLSLPKARGSRFNFFTRVVLVMVCDT